MYNGYHFWGMHLFWWIIWIIFLITIFGWFDPVPKIRRKKQTPLEILQRRLAAGEITMEEYEQRKTILNKDATTT